jgi:hypothetical protein
MALKSYDFIKKKKRKKKKRTRDLITGGVTALVGIGLLSETASAIRRI